ncbi:MAG: hypothetical protein MJZ21_03170 [archaeon]|nr:hypothetical protein [archaeon]
MTDINMEGNSSKKKYLIPLVALLICGMAFTGAAYAYSASIQTSGDLAVQSYELDIDGANTISFKDCYVQFDSKKTNGVVSYTVTLEEGKEKQVVKTATISINSNAKNTEKFSVTSCNVVCNDEKAEGLDFEATGTMNEAQTEATVVITASGTLSEAPLAKYNLTLTVVTAAA